MPLLPPGTPPPPQEALVAASLVFQAPAHSVSINNPLAWWQWRPKANWKQPEGPGSSIVDRMDHPVVHVSYFDALAYAEWKGMSLPTEAQWEYAARGGKEQMIFTWGNQLLSETSPIINTWQGKFPHKNTEADGYYGTSPVKTFAPNDYGLYDMSGNVWEWCLTTWQTGSNNISDNDTWRVIRGGSWVRDKTRARVTHRGEYPSNSWYNAIGFRIAAEFE